MNEQMIKDQVTFFMDEKIEVHIRLNNKSFLNGFIEKKLRDDVYWFTDRKLNGVYLFLKQIYEIEPVKDRGIK